MRILLVEDERDLNYAMAKGLKKSGYAVDSAYDGEEALDLFHINAYDLILLDLNLPKMDGIDVLKAIRTEDLYVRIMIVSARTAIDERVLGLDLGANDYLIKPFDFKELEARIRTLLRMNYYQNPSILTVLNLSLNTNSKKVYINDTEIELTRKEYSILEYLMLHKDRLVSNEELFEHIWDCEADEFSNTLKFHMHSLKKKLANISDIEYITNKRGQGYRVREENAKD